MPRKIDDQERVIEFFMKAPPEVAESVHKTVGTIMRNRVDLGKQISLVAGAKRRGRPPKTEAVVDTGPPAA